MNHLLARTDRRIGNDMVKFPFNLFINIRLENRRFYFISFSILSRQIQGTIINIDHGRLNSINLSQGQAQRSITTAYIKDSLSLVDLKTLEQELTAKVNHFLAKNTRIRQKGHFFSQQVHSQLMNVVSSVRIFCIIHFTHETILP